jgi:valyl-tRNA synthetase
MSLRSQAHDIINFWLFYTLARAYIHSNSLPWKDVAISGFVLDPKGEKMSKSKGNIIEPESVIDLYGADSLRFWASQSLLGEDLRYNQEEVKQGKRAVTKLWNASRFCMLHIENYSFNKSDRKLLQDEDKWILHKFSVMVKEYYQKMDAYEYSRAKEQLDKFFWSDFCDNYLEIIKFRVYELKDKGAFFTLYSVLLNILKLYAPIMPFITEEIYQEYFKATEKAESIHLLLLPKDSELYNFSKVVSNFENVIDIIDQIRKYKSEQKMSVKAEIDNISVKVKAKKKIKKYLPLIEKMMAVKKIEIG